MKDPAIGLPFFLRPAPVFAAVQLLPLTMWLLVSDRTMSIALLGAAKANFGLSSALGFGSLVLAFTIGSHLGYRRWPQGVRVGSSHFSAFIRLAHFTALGLSVFSAGYLLLSVIRSGVNVVGIVAAAQANVLHDVVYTTSVLSKALIMGRHLVFTSMVTWFACGADGSSRPPTLPLIVVTAGTLLVFTSSRLTVIALMLIALVYWFAPGQSKNHARSWRRRVLLVAAVFAVGAIFAIGVWSRGVATWTSATGRSGLLAAPAYEGIAYLVSPVNYSVAFVEGGVSFVRGAGLDHFFNFAHTVLNLPVDYSYRDAISWYYAPRLNRVGLLGEWFTIVGPLLWVPALVYGFVAGVTHAGFRQRTLWGMLLYPLILIALFDSTRGFLLADSIVASNILFVLLILALTYLAQIILSTPRPESLEVAHGITQT